MNSFIDLARTFASQPLHLGVLLGRADVGRGREGLFRDQMPELLASLADQTRIESIRASTAIEGYDVPENRAANLAGSPPARVRGRNEKEFAGYRDAIDGVIRAERPERLSVPFILHLHRQLYSPSGGRGGRLKSEDNQIVGRDDSGSRRLIFATVSWTRAPFVLGELVDRYNAACDRQEAHPVVLLGAFTLDFLAIHPALDGNGRLARLLTTHEFLRTGYGVARYVSIEQRIYETRNAYYEALRASQIGWHEARHDACHWVVYFAGRLAEAYEIFEARMASARKTAGLSKHDTVRRHVELMPVGAEFRFRDIRVALPGISDPTLSLALASLRKDGMVSASGRGRGAVWQRTAPSAQRAPGA